MADDPEYEVLHIGGLRLSQARGVVLLRASDESLNAYPVFNSRDTSETSAQKKYARTLKDRFDFWIDGGHRNNWFHGWPNHATYKDCFVFKWIERNIDQRIYGFLTHPMPKCKPSFQLCVLHTHTEKTRANTDTAYLDLAVQLKSSADVKRAITLAFPDMKA